MGFGYPHTHALYHTAMPTISRCLPDRLIALELNLGDSAALTLRDGSMRLLTVIATRAWITDTTLPLPRTLPLHEVRGAVTNFRFEADLQLDGKPFTIQREASTPASFYEPLVIDGLVIYLDAVDAVFDFLIEAHGRCRPSAACRLAVHDAACRVCPQPIHPFCPLPAGGLRIEDCYTGEDCWLGAYFGAAAHGGLDINHPSGTPIYAPLDIHDHYLFNSLAKGQNNNRWRGIHRWDDGSEWHVQCHHLNFLTVPEHTPVKAGQQIADGAGVYVGDCPHSHFEFKIVEPGDRGEMRVYLLDPWVLFRTMYQDQP